MCPKIKQARLRTTGETKDLSEISTHDNGNLKCSHCEALIHYKPTTYRHFKNGAIRPVQQHLASNHGQKHSWNCPIENPPEVRKTTWQAKGISIKKTFFRDEIFYPKLRSFKPMLSGTKPQYTRSYQNKSYSQKSLSCAEKIAAIREHVAQGNPNKIYVQCYDKTIKWKNFFFEQNEYNKLISYLPTQKTNQLIALFVTVKVLKANSIQCFREPKGKSSIQEKIIIPHLYSNNLKPEHIFKEGKSYLVVGEAKITENSNFINININLYHKNQITEIKAPS